MLPAVKRPDRLSALVSRFALEVQPSHCAVANLLVLAATTEPFAMRVVFAPSGEIPAASRASMCNNNQTVFSATATMGGSGNPLMHALPELIDLGVDEDSDMKNLITLLVSESNQGRCGAGSVVNRLGEVLLVRLFRALLATGNTDVGLMAGLADARLSRAIVAMHEQPGDNWRIDMLAKQAGMSTSHFAAHFASVVGQTPMSYLRQWRMALARQDIGHGDRVQAVANRYGYASTEALSRAFRKHYGCNPLAMRAAQDA